MTIYSVEKSWSQRGGSISSQDGQTATAKATEGWQITHSADATESEILAAPGLPQVGDRFGSSFLICTHQSANSIGLLFSMVTIDYEGEIGINSEGKPDSQQSPIDNDPIIEWSDEASNEPVDVDWNGKPIQTVNGEKINGATMEVSDPVLIVTKNFANYNPHLIHAYRMATNSDVFASFAPGTARLIAAPGKLMKHSNSYYWQVTARFKFRYVRESVTTPDKAWYFRTLHEGFLAINNDTDVLEHARVNDEKVVTPVCLTEDGYQIPATDLPDAAVFKEFQLYDSLPFRALGFINF